MKASNCLDDECSEIKDVEGGARGEELAPGRVGDGATSGCWRFAKADKNLLTCFLWENQPC